MIKFKIHRGTKEIGGSCVEIWTNNTRIVIDIGSPLVEQDGAEFDFKKYQTLSHSELIQQKILPNIAELYNSDNIVDGILISHAHLDHYGFSRFVNANNQFYLGEATHEIIEISNLFTRQNIQLRNCSYFEKEVPFTIGDFTITPYWNDHSAFDAYSFLVEANGKKIFYSGDFRSHGRKTKVFQRFLKTAPQNVDYLLLEGTQIGRQNKITKSEFELENELTNVFKNSNGINLIYTSSQNLDRIVSIYKACIKSNKTMIVDVYTAYVLKTLSKFAKIPFPSKSFKNLKVLYTKFVSNKLSRTGQEKILYQFKDHKITKEKISINQQNYVMLVRPSMKIDLEYIKNLRDGNVVYSMWEGYLKKSYTKKFIDYLQTKNFTFHNIHSSGHADVNAMKKLVNAMNPQKIIPIHTFEKQEYKNIFSIPIVELNDTEELTF
jgi:ribonuclease J